MHINIHILLFWASMIVGENPDYLIDVHKNEELKSNICIKRGFYFKNDADLLVKKGKNSNLEIKNFTKITSRGCHKTPIISHRIDFSNELGSYIPIYGQNIYSFWESYDWMLSDLYVYSPERLFPWGIGIKELDYIYLNWKDKKIEYIKLNILFYKVPEKLFLSNGNEVIPITLYRKLILAYFEESTEYSMSQRLINFLKPYEIYEPKYRKPAVRGWYKKVNPEK